MAETISLDFRRPIALFPLPGVVLLPHAVQPLHIFEERYRQMVETCIARQRGGELLTADPIALAAFAGDAWREDYEGEPPLRSAVCVGKIVQHQELSDGRHNLLLQGVCRARIRSIIEPEGPRLFRLGRLEPLERIGDPPPGLPGVRGALRSLLDNPRLKSLAGGPTVREWIARKDVPTHALLELVGFALINDCEIRYRLLAEPDPKARAKLIRFELRHLADLVGKSEEQAWRRWPKGVSWN